MKNIKQKIIFALILLPMSYILFSQTQKVNYINNYTGLLKIKHNKDSCQNIICYVGKKQRIPTEVIKSNTIIDSIYISEATFFTGNMLYNISDEYSAAIIHYDNGICTYKFILIINLKTNKNTDYILGFSDCDRDGDNEFSSYDFSIKSDKITVIKKFAAKGVEIEDSKQIETTTYVIDDQGKLKEIDPQRH